MESMRALSLILLPGSGLLLRGFAEFHEVNSGFESAG